jgi:hypothetical protein
MKKGSIHWVHVAIFHWLMKTIVHNRV